MTVSIIDACMGVGKTTSMIKYMGDNPDKRYLYISPFKSEVGDGNTGMLGRLQVNLPDMFPLESMPKNYGDGKTSNLKRLLREGGNIATTHALFGRFDNEIVDLVIENDFVIIIDEAVDNCIQMYADLTAKDVAALVKSRWITVDPKTYRVQWNERKNPEFDGRYADIRQLADCGCLYLFRGRVLVSEYPPRLLKECKQCFIMTYLWEGSLMSCWMKRNGILYEYDNGKTLQLGDPTKIKDMIRKNLTVLSSRKIDNMYNKDLDKTYRYSSNWYKKSSNSDKLEIKKALESCVANYGEKDGKVLWTTFLGYEDKLSGKGYKKNFVSPDTGEEMQPFLSFTTKAINDYREHDLVLYTVNLFKSRTEIDYLSSKGVEFNEDLWALSIMLQFIWRARIRQGMPTKVLVLSQRMRKLLLDWLEGGK